MNCQHIYRSSCGLLRRARLVGFAIVMAYALVACSGGGPKSKPLPTSTVAQTSIANTAPASVTLTIGGSEMPVSGNVGVATPTLERTPGSPSVNDSVAPPRGGSSNRDCSPPTDQYVDSEHYKQQLACAYDYFSWPAAYQLDLQTTFRLLDQNQKDSAFEKGFEFNYLLTWNICAWYSDWLAARSDGDSAREQAALNVMTSELPNYLTTIPHFPAAAEVIGLSDGLRQMAGQAALGDPTGVQGFIQGNCSFGYDPWVQQP